MELFDEIGDTERDTEKVDSIAGPGQPAGEEVRPLHPGDSFQDLKQWSCRLSSFSTGNEIFEKVRGHGGCMKLRWSDSDRCYLSITPVCDSCDSEFK